MASQDSTTSTTQAQCQTENPASNDKTTNQPPAWQLSAPQAELRINKETQTGGEAQLANNFGAIIEHIQTGAEMPGVVRIPDTVVPAPTSSGRPAPPKPWERRAVAKEEERKDGPSETQDGNADNA